MMTPIHYLLLAILIALIIWPGKRDKIIHLMKRPFDIEIIGKDIIVFSSVAKLTISKKDLFDWLDEHGRLDWVYDWNDQSQYDGHGQRTGKYLFDEYFNLDDDEIKKDIRIYLKSLI